MFYVYFLRIFTTIYYTRFVQMWFIKSRGEVYFVLVLLQRIYPVCAESIVNLHTVNVDFVTFEYVLLIKYQSICQFGNLTYQKAPQLDQTSVLGIFTRSIANDQWEGGWVWQMMFFDSILKCISSFSPVFGSTAQYGYNGKGWMGKSRLLGCILFCIVT